MRHFYPCKPHKSPCDICELVLKSIHQADLIFRLYLLFYLPVLKVTGPQQPAASFLFYRVLPGKRFGLLFNERVKPKGLPKNLKKKVN